MEDRDIKPLKASYHSSRFLSIDQDLDNVELSNLTIEEEQIYFESKERFGSIVEYKDGRFTLSQEDGDNLNISPDLFEHFSSLMNISNTVILELEEEGIYDDVEISTQEYTTLTYKRTKTRTETSGGGETKYVLHWWGFDVYLSQRTLIYIAGGSSIGSYIATIVPDPFLSKVVAGVFCASGVAASILAYEYPGGVIIKFTYPITPIVGCVVYGVQAQ